MVGGRALCCSRRLGRQDEQKSQVRRTTATTRTFNYRLLEDLKTLIVYAGPSSGIVGKSLLVLCVWAKMQH